MSLGPASYNELRLSAELPDRAQHAIQSPLYQTHQPAWQGGGGHGGGAAEAQGGQPAAEV